MFKGTVLNINSQSFNFGFDRLHSLAEIMEAAKRYPYSLPVQAYLAKTLKLSDSFDYERFEKRSAVLSPDRQWLYGFIQAAVAPAQVQEVKVPEIQQVEEKIETSIPLKPAETVTIRL